MKETIPEPDETCNRLSMPSHFSAQGAILAAMQFPKADRAPVSTAARASAETLALQALAWIAAEPDRLSGLMADHRPLAR
ncbi:DUF3572 family protein [Elstera litoralis]|uniref:DUF3572 family protein n=1 Tax=Elstera litoralis TaxID=552518 RepID=UPI000AC50614|nr:DUF3572 family protein [Elstera litoralis]